MIEDADRYDTAAPPPYTPTDSTTLAAFANPTRSRLLDALAADGPSTPSALARRVGIASGSASHHLKVLAEAGLVEEAEGLSEDRRQRHWRLAHAQTRWSRHELTDESARAAAYEAELLSLRRQYERARAALLASEDDRTPTGAFATQLWVALTPDELDELSREIVAVFTRWKRRTVPQDGADRQPCFLFARGFPSAP